MLEEPRICPWLSRGKIRVAAVLLLAELIPARQDLEGAHSSYLERGFSGQPALFPQSWMILPATLQLLQCLALSPAPQPPCPTVEPLPTRLGCCSRSSTGRIPIFPAAAVRKWPHFHQELCKAFECRAALAPRRRSAPTAPFWGGLAGSERLFATLISQHR